MRQGLPAAVLVALLALAPAASAQRAAELWLPLPHPTDTGKPPIYDPQFAAKDDNDRRLGCSPALLQCRFQLLGVIQNNGAVELRATAFTW